MFSRLQVIARPLVSLSLTLALFSTSLVILRAQDVLTGAFDGRVTDSVTGNPIAGARIRFTSKTSGIPYTKRSDANGAFYQGLLSPDVYTIEVTAQGYQPWRRDLLLQATRQNAVIPVPVVLVPVAAAPTTPTTPPVTAPSPGVPVTAPSPNATNTPQPPGPVTSPTTPPTGTAGATAPLKTNPGQVTAQSSQDIRIVQEINRTDGRRGGAYTEDEVSTLPLGATTLVRTFDELALLLPGVALPPQTIGNGSGPGIGAGVGSAGQFTANGMPPRANNFLVDGSDNNDEDIGVRRQGFLSLVPQPIESIKEYQVTTLLAPAQYGRNMGAQVNAISKSGGTNTHGTLYGFYNSSALNARNFFDTTNGNGISAVTAGNNQPVIVCPLGNPRCLVGGTPSTSAGTPLAVQNGSGGKDPFTLAQFGGVIGGPIGSKKKLFYFASAERQILNGAQEGNFAVPTVEQRSFANTGATGLFFDPFNFQRFTTGGTVAPAFLTTQTAAGAAVFSLFPFPNNPNGVYGANTFTERLPADGRGLVLSGKIDYNTVYKERQQTLTGRYNFTNDERTLPVTGGALFSSLRPHVQTNNISTFLNSELSGPESTAPLFNQLRLSYGRTRLTFAEIRDPFLSTSRFAGQSPFLLNAPVLVNTTLPVCATGTPGTATISGGVTPTQVSGCINGATVSMPTPNTGPVTFVRTGQSTEDVLGALGQVNIAGFSPLGVDVYNFPQTRVDNTYQLADTLSYRKGKSSFAFGIDFRRTELNSTLPRNVRPLATFAAAPALQNSAALGGVRDISQIAGTFTNLPGGITLPPFFTGLDYAAAGTATGFFQSVTRTNDFSIGLRYYQYDFFGQNEWHVRPNLSISYGLRYEYNTPPREVNNRIESAFSTPAAVDPAGYASVASRRSQIFNPDRNNIAPRFGIAYSPNLFGPDRPTVIRGGVGVYYDQILGAVVSQSRNTPTFSLPVNVGSSLFPTPGVPVSSRTFSLPGGGVVTLPGNSLFFAQASALFIATDPLHGNQPFLLQQSNCVTSATLTCLGPLVAPGTFGTLNTSIPFQTVLQALNFFRSDLLSFTLPAQNMPMPQSYQFSYSIEQALPKNLVVSFAYVGTRGRHLLRFATPNLGPNVFPEIGLLLPGPTLGVGGLNTPTPQIFGQTSSLGTTGRRPDVFAGPITAFQTTGQSRYDAAQVQLRGRLRNPGSLQFQVAYTYSRSFDDVSDPFDLAGASALPQDSATFAGEYGRSNFDAPNRLSYNMIYDFPSLSNANPFVRAIFGNFQIASTGQFQSGQPFTVNSLLDVNLDGNLTDRLNNTNGLQITNNNGQPLALTTTNTRSLLAPVGSDGSIGRNTFRAGNLLLLNLAFQKRFLTRSEQRGFLIRMEIFNFTNRTNFGIPVRYLEAVGFGRAVDTVTPGRRIQFALKYTF